MTKSEQSSSAAPQPPNQGQETPRRRRAALQLTSDGKIVGWSEGAAEMFGFSRDEALGRGVAELLSPDGGAEAWRALLAQDGSVPQLQPCARKGGGEILCSWVHAPGLDARGEQVGIVCFGEDVGGQTDANAEHERHARFLRALVDNVPFILWGIDREGNFTFHDGKGIDSLGMPRGFLLGKNAFTLYPSEQIRQLINRALDGEVLHERTEDDAYTWDNWYVPVRDERGEVTTVLGLTFEATHLKKAEQDLMAKLEVIERQQEVIQQLSTPIIQVWDGVLTLPMIGVVDSVRTADVMQSLLDEVSRTQSKYAILDLTGVDAVDTKTASYLLELVHAVRLLGAEGIITGIRSNVAQTMVSLGVDLSDITTLGNLRAGLRYCIARSYRKAASGGAAPKAPAGPSGSPLATKPPPSRG